MLSEHSEIRVRMLGHTGTALKEGDFASSISAAYARRLMLGLNGPHDAFRLVNSEGDGLPGLIVDHLGQVLTVQITTAPMARRQEDIFAALLGLFPEHAILRIPPPSFIAAKEKFEFAFGWQGKTGPDTVEVLEGGVRFVIPTAQVQKTGHYADMRIHRQWIGGIARGKRVLDAYSYSGGFGLHALAGGASQVVCVDSSEAACAAVRANADANSAQLEVVCSKVDDFLRSASDRGHLYDIVVLDPPKLAPSRKHVAGALKVYESLTLQALRVIERGLLCLGSCSEAIGLPELERILGAAQARSGRRLSVVYTGTQSPDHPYPAAMSEGRYLTFLACTVE
ncbi:MAG: class I SAM-dependent methyltransferase [bacterium]